MFHIDLFVSLEGCGFDTMHHCFYCQSSWPPITQGCNLVYKSEFVIQFVLQKFLCWFDISVLVRCRLRSSKLLVLLMDAMPFNSFSATSSIVDSSYLPTFCTVVLSQGKYVFQPICFLLLRDLLQVPRCLVSFS